MRTDVWILLAFVLLILLIFALAGRI